MAHNFYDDRFFFEQYSQMPRSLKGLDAAGEWATFRDMLPSLENTNVLDLGCGYGWHCEYAVAQHAAKVVGIDISEKMLQRARQQPHADQITFIKGSIDDLEEMGFESHEFDVVMSSLAFHYLPDFETVVEQVKAVLTFNGTFIFSIEHPIYTAHHSQDWVYDAAGKPAHWPVDDYQYEGERQVEFLETRVIKYHRTLSHYLNVLIDHHFVIDGLAEPVPSEKMLEESPHMKEELRRPMMLIISARRK